MVEHAAHNRGVAGSIPATATSIELAALAAASGLVAAGSRVVAAVSGGADSTALLVALTGLGCDVIAAHYDHALRPDSAADSEHVARLCHDVGVRLVRERRDLPLDKGSPEAAARRLRYAFLEKVRRESRAELIAVGHTADDVSEGVLLHLRRGTGLAGARGIPARNGRVVRPLLKARRSALRALLARCGVGWLEDPTNADLHQARAYVRHRLLPRLEHDRPGLTKRLIGAADAAARLQDRLTRAAADLHTGPSADLPTLEAAPPVVRAEALRRLYFAAGGPEPGLGRVHLAAMLRLVSAARTGATLDLPGGLVFRVGRGGVAVVPAGSPGPGRPEVEARACPGCAATDAIHLPAGTAFRVGRRSPGLRLRRPGGHTRKLQDLLVDAHVPRWDRDGVPLVFVGERLVWVPDVAHDPDACLPVGRPGLHIEFKTGGPKEDAW